MSKVLNLESVKDTKLYKELLKRKNEATKAFVANIPDLCQEAEDRAKLIPKFFFEYTLHDRTHFLRVTELMAHILGDTIRELNEIEIGLLILSAFYHDQGMLITEQEFKSLDIDEAYILFRDNWILEHPNYTEIKKQLESSFISNNEQDRLSKSIAELDTAILTDFLRESHGQRSHDYILSAFSTERILSVNGINISGLLAKICLSHVKSIDWIISNNGLHYDENVGSEKINSIFLCLILRLADILDFDSDRTPDVLFKSIHFTSSVSISEWQKHRSISGWEISKDIIRFSMYFEHPAYEKTAKSFLDYIESELHICISITKNFPSNISNYQLKIPEKIDRNRLGPKDKSYLYHDLEFTLSRNEIVKLLMTDKLYKNTSLFIRELLQNSLDALRLRKALHLKDGFEWKGGEIHFKHYIDSDKQQVIECRDNGCGMDENIVSKFLGKVGRSYYRSPEFERQRIQFKEKGVDFDPCSQFGIGFMSCFMVSDRIQILTRRDYGHGKETGKPLIIEINGLGGLIVIKEGNPKQEIGTIVRLFTRNKPFFFDEWSDNIRLITTLKGYALANEFPIKASCLIDELKEELTIHAAIDKKKTFLESMKVKNKETIEVDLQGINKNLRGFLRQSFLIDNNNLFCVENDEALWESQIDETWKDSDKLKITLLKKDTRSIHKYERHYAFDRGQSVCIDGILVCGYPGRAEYTKGEVRFLPHISSGINCEHCFTVDVRGNIKPELTPAREPLHRGRFTDIPTSWLQLQEFINIGSGLIWERVLNQTEIGLSPEIFWKLLVIHEGSPLSINCNAIFKNLYLPVGGKDWIKFSSLASFFVDGKTILATGNDGNKYIIQFSDEIISWGRTYINGLDFKYLITSLLICLSKYNPKIKYDQLLFRSSFEASEIPKNRIISREITTITSIPFDGLTSDYLTTTKYVNIVNSENPLIKIICIGKYIKIENEIQEFARVFVFGIRLLIQELEKDRLPFTKELRLRILKHASTLFRNIDWSKYSNDLKPPYKIYIDENNTVEITEVDFDNWANMRLAE